MIQGQKGQKGPKGTANVRALRPACLRNRQEASVAAERLVRVLELGLERSHQVIWAWWATVGLGFHPSDKGVIGGFEQRKVSVHRLVSLLSGDQAV